jgi:phosphoribosylaminoimidazolecarboxamide formyltransferase/IMP cyclohydrolase
VRALLSVYDKQGLVEFARVLASAGFELISTGRTHRELMAAGVKATQVSDVTGAPEILDGRVKTLHPRIHGGILGRRSLESHRRQMAENGIEPIDVVVCNLYPFTETISRPGVSLDDALENIDIGGPAMVRAAAKNFQDVVVVVDPGDYDRVGKMLAEGGVAAVTIEERRRLAAKAFQHVSVYDSVVAGYLSSSDSVPPPELPIGWRLVTRPRYGENPHQGAGIYATPGEAGGIVNAVQLHGIEMSYLNYFDADGAWTAASAFPRHAVAIVKHANPCGLAVHGDQAEAYRRALSGDPVSAFGGIVGFNSEVTAATAETMKGVLYDVVVAPGYEPAALETLKSRRRTRVLKVAGAAEGRWHVRTVSGGALVQGPDSAADDPASWKVATKRKPTDRELSDLAFAWRACRFVHSNAIVLASDNTLVGMGAGQPNRATSVFLAARVAGDRAKGSVMASDAFFPFPDGIERAAEAGVTAVAQPGGSVKDEEVIAAANRLGLAMVFTGTRHFLH